jgi:sugar lactone lactonase YvrE
MGLGDAWMIRQLKATLAIDSRDVVGEGPAWDATGDRALWLDNGPGIIHAARPDREGKWAEIAQRNLGRSTGALVPRAKGGLVIVAGTEVLSINELGDIVCIARIDADPNVVKLNDAKCDPQGRLWAGTYAHDFRPGLGELYRIDPDGRVSTMLKDVGLSNGLDWSPDGTTFYYIDSFTASVDAFDFEGARGTISRRRHILTIPANEGGLDGMSVDREGCLWLALFGSGEVRRYRPDGTLIMRVEVSAPAVSSCAFGGGDGSALLITTASLRIPDPVLPVIGWIAGMADDASTAPGAGGLFVCRPGVTGKPATPFAG